MMWIPSCLEDGNMSIMNPEMRYRGKRYLLLVSFLEVVTNFIAKVDASNFKSSKKMQPLPRCLVEFCHPMTESRSLFVCFLPKDWEACQACDLLKTMTEQSTQPNVPWSMQRN